MISRKNILIILLSLAAGGLLTWWLYVRFHILFLVIFIPIVSFGIPVFRRLFLPKGENQNGDGGRGDKSGHQ
jgi:hypothetical protein